MIKFPAQIDSTIRAQTNFLWKTSLMKEVKWNAISRFNEIHVPASL